MHSIELSNCEKLMQSVLLRIFELVRSLEKEARLTSLRLLNTIIFSKELSGLLRIVKRRDDLPLQGNTINGSNIPLPKEAGTGGVSDAIYKLSEHFTSKLNTSKRSETRAELAEFSIDIVCRCMEDLLEHQELDENSPTGRALAFFFLCNCDTQILDTVGISCLTICSLYDV